MKHIVAVNASPRTTWNTASLIQEAAKGAETEGAKITYFDLYRLEPFSGCVSCFGCKLPNHEGVCVCKDGLTPVLDAIRNADGLILGTPNYLDNVTAGFRALYERLIFQTLTYCYEPRSYNQKKIPVLFIMTSNMSEAYYSKMGYDQMITGYQRRFNSFIGPTKVLISSDTLQVSDYDRYHWDMFDPEAKKLRHETVFPQDLQKAFDLGAKMVIDPWKE